MTLFLVQNGVLGARESPRSERLAELAALGVEILADEFSLRERGIRVERLARVDLAVSRRRRPAGS